MGRFWAKPVMTEYFAKHPIRLSDKQLASDIAAEFRLYHREYRLYITALVIVVVELFTV